MRVRAAPECVCVSLARARPARRQGAPRTAPGERAVGSTCARADWPAPAGVAQRGRRGPLAARLCLSVASLAGGDTRREAAGQRRRRPGPLGKMSGPGARSSHLSQPVVKSVLVYRNGDPFFAGRRVVIHEKKVSSFDVFLKEVTGGVQAPFGAVRNIYTPRTGHRIRKLDQIESGGNYVAGGQEAFKKLK